jgi:hypothetical protein
MTFEEFSKKKVLGVPVLYLAAAAAIILGVVAWKMKPTPEEVVTDPDPSAEEEDPLGGAGSDYSGLATQGTVTVVQGGSSDQQEAKEETNEDWEKAAVAYLIADKNATAQDAQAAISKYLDGADLSYEEGQLKNAAVAKLGLPPERLSNVGSVGTLPAQKQFSLFPGKHTVKGSNDNTPGKIAQLYWGKNDGDKIVSANYKLGPVGTTYAVGTVVSVPSWYEPRYYTVTKTTQYPSQLASKNGSPYDQVIALNPGKIAPYAVGSKIRIG